MTTMHKVHSTLSYLREKTKITIDGGIAGVSCPVGTDNGAILISH